MPDYCVTGGTGLVASHLIRTLLEKGHSVRATVRDPEDATKVGFLMSIDGAKERLRLMKADLMAEGSFDEAVDGVDGVFHTACPVHVPPGADVKEAMIDPTIQGTENVLKSCSKSSSVRRVVLTSSLSAVAYFEYADVASPLNESHWSDPEYCKKTNSWYPYSKTMAEKAAWQLAKEINLDLVVVNPSFVVGPVISPQPTSSMFVILSFLKGEWPCYPETAIELVHIDDVVSVHIIAMEDDRAAGRLVCSNKIQQWAEIVEMLRVKYPSLPLPTKGYKVGGPVKPHSIDTTKIEKLGLSTFKSASQMFDDCIKSFQEKGLLPS